MNDTEDTDSVVIEIEHEDTGSGVKGVDIYEEDSKWST